MFFFEPRIMKQIYILYKYSGAQCTLTQPELLIFKTYWKGRPLWDYWFLTECVHILRGDTEKDHQVKQVEVKTNNVMWAKDDKLEPSPLFLWSRKQSLSLNQLLLVQEKELCHSKKTFLCFEV